MGNINYFCSIVKVLEDPIQIQINNKISITTFRVELFQVRKNYTNQLIFLYFWGKLSEKIKNYCNINEYILIEGYLQVKEKKSKTLPFTNLKQIIVTVLRVYPI